MKGFRVLQVKACAAALAQPQAVELDGHMISGAANRVRVNVTSLPDFVIMKAHALQGRDKPKDVYDLCYCLGDIPGAREQVAVNWRTRRGDPLVEKAIAILPEKFETVDHRGPRQLAIFHDANELAERARHARRAFELVQALLRLLE